MHTKSLLLGTACRGVGVLGLVMHALEAGTLRLALVPVDALALRTPEAA